MTIDEAFQELINSPDYKAISKGRESEGIKYRVYSSRFKKGTLKAGAMVDILLANGFEIKANKAKKKRA